MRFAGVDIAAEAHTVAVMDEKEVLLVKPTVVGEDADGYAKLIRLLGPAEDILIAMEATGHYWKNVFATLVAGGFPVALINPLRTRRFAEEDLERTKTDAIDAVGIARFAVHKRPAATRLPDLATDELRELVRHRERLVQTFGDRVRQLHRLVDLGFPEFTRHIRDLGGELACAVLQDFPTAQAFQGVSVRRLARLCYDERHKVGEDLARRLIEAARVSVGRHHGPAYRVQVRHTCEDLDILRRRIRELGGDIERFLADHEVGSLLTSIKGIGVQTSARLIAELGDPASFRSSAALAAYVGPVPALKQSGKKPHTRAGMSRIGNASLRAALWMPTLVAVQKNPWLRAHYERLIARGKPRKLALIACMRKLLTAVYSVAKNRRPFVPNLAPERAP
jgi:transposase